MKKLMLFFFVFVFLIAIASATWTSNLNNNLNNYYKFDDNSDLFGRNNLKILDGQIPFSSANGIIGKGGIFEYNASMYIENSTKSIWNWTNKNLTLNLWVYRNGNPATATLFTSVSGGYYINSAPTQIAVASLGLDEIDVPFTGGKWAMLTIKKNDTNTYVYYNATLKGNSSNKVPNTPTDNITLGDGTMIGESNWNGSIDEMAMWTRDLSDAEISQLYNGGTGTGYGDDVYVNVLIPTNNTINLGRTMTFNCSAGTDINKIQNLSLWVNGVLNYTVNDGADNFTSLQLTQVMPFGDYNWSCAAWDNSTTSRQKNSSIYHFNTKGINS